MKRMCSRERWAGPNCISYSYLSTVTEGKVKTTRQASFKALYKQALSQRDSGDTQDSILLH